MSSTINITTCPSCGSNMIKYVQQDWTGQYHGQMYVVPALDFYECMTCGEKLYDRNAMRKIEAYSPAFQKTPFKKSSQSRRKMQVKRNKMKSVVEVT